MATIKSFTDLEQSKKLAEILPPESADMEYMFLKEDGTKVTNIPFVKDDEESEWPNDSAYDFIPCWSISALLDVLPDESDNDHFLTLQKEKNEYCCCYEDINGNSFTHTFAGNPIDACVEMIIKLYELNLL